MTPQDHELIHDYLHGRLRPEDEAPFHALLNESAEARARLRTEATIETRLRELATSETLAATVPMETRAGNAGRSPGWLAPAAAGIVLGVVFATATWASVAALRREPDPTPLPVANGDFEVRGPNRIGGFPKAPGWWRGDAAECVAGTAEVRPHMGAGMLRFLHSDGRRDNPAGGFSACDQWQLLDLSNAIESDPAVAEAEAWFNSVPTSANAGSEFQLTLYAIRVNSLEELNPISSVWLRRSSAVLATSSRRIVADADPATWERGSVNLPLPAGAKYLLVQLAAVGQPLSVGPQPFPGQFADSVSVRVRKASRDAAFEATR